MIIEANPIRTPEVGEIGGIEELTGELVPKKIEGWVFLEGDWGMDKDILGQIRRVGPVETEEYLKEQEQAEIEVCEIAGVECKVVGDRLEVMADSEAEVIRLFEEMVKAMGIDPRIYDHGEFLNRFLEGELTESWEIKQVAGRSYVSIPVGRQEPLAVFLKLEELAIETEEVVVEEETVTEETPEPTEIAAEGEKRLSLVPVGENQAFFQGSDLLINDLERFKVLMGDYLESKGENRKMVEVREVGGMIVIGWKGMTEEEVKELVRLMDPEGQVEGMEEKVLGAFQESQVDGFEVWLGLGKKGLLIVGGGAAVVLLIGGGVVVTRQIEAKKEKKGKGDSGKSWEKGIEERVSMRSAVDSGVSLKPKKPVVDSEVNLPARKPVEKQSESGKPKEKDSQESEVKKGEGGEGEVASEPVGQITRGGQEQPHKRNIRREEHRDKAQRLRELGLDAEATMVEIHDRIDE